MTPSDIRLTDAGLAIQWPDGRKTTLAAATLRAEARDAASRRALYDHGKIHIEDGLRIDAMAEVGGYGINLAFSDGHDSAIYPFPYLRTLSERFDN